MQEDCLVQLEIKEPLRLLAGFCDLSINVTLAATLDDILFDFYSHIAEYKPFSHRTTMRIFIGSTLQLLGMKQKNHLVENVIFNYYVCTDIIVSLLS